MLIYSLDLPQQIFVRVAVSISVRTHGSMEKTESSILLEKYRILTKKRFASEKNIPGRIFFQRALCVVRFTDENLCFSKRR